MSRVVVVDWWQGSKKIDDDHHHSRAAAALINQYCSVLFCSVHRQTIEKAEGYEIWREDTRDGKFVSKPTIKYIQLRITVVWWKHGSQLADQSSRKSRVQLAKPSRYRPIFWSFTRRVNVLSDRRSLAFEEESILLAFVSFTIGWTSIKKKTFFFSFFFFVNHFQMELKQINRPSYGFDLSSSTSSDFGRIVQMTTWSNNELWRVVHHVHNPRTRVRCAGVDGLFRWEFISLRDSHLMTVVDLSFAGNKKKKKKKERRKKKYNK